MSLTRAVRFDGTGRRGPYEGLGKDADLRILDLPVLEGADAPPVSEDLDHLSLHGCRVKKPGANARRGINISP